jgi:hypothetical protein
LKKLSAEAGGIDGTAENIIKIEVDQYLRILLNKLFELRSVPGLQNIKHNFERR